MAQYIFGEEGDAQKLPPAPRSTNPAFRAFALFVRKVEEAIASGDKVCCLKLP